MRCTSPRTVGFRSDGKTICWSKNQYSKEYATFQLPCGKCIECRLDYARQWAVRCVHEAQMHESNAFITLTYSDENLRSTKLIYQDFQNFMKRLRKTQSEPIGCFVTGEYGELNKRPHWHALLFNWRPPKTVRGPGGERTRDVSLKYTSPRGDKVYTSETLTKTWGQGSAEFGAVTLHSANYCARYAAKKLTHGKDGEHEYEPISKKSSKHAIGKKWIEKYWPDVFNYGELVLPDGKTCSIPRYYEKWFKENHPEKWACYVTTAKLKKITAAALRAEKIENEYRQNLICRSIWKPNPLTPNQKRNIIQLQKFKKLQDHLKL